MRPRCPPGSEGAAAEGGRASGTAFVEAVVTMLLLALFAALAFPLYWSASKASAAQGLETAARRSELVLATALPRFTEAVRIPYWSKPESAFSESGSECSAAFYGGDSEARLALRKDGPSRLRITSPEGSLAIDGLPELGLAWWKKGERTIGITVSWSRGSERVELRSAWGSFPL